MNRSRTQIATSYAPGALFTYEGGLGCCVSLPVSNPYTPSSPAVQKQLFERLTEFVESWFDRAMKCRPAPAVLPEQCVDSAFRDHKKEPRVDSGGFLLNQPTRMGFMPDPLVFVCSDCARLTEFANIDDLVRDWRKTEQRTDCGKPDAGRRHNWKQLDVVFAHWSGTYQGLSPFRYVMGPDGSASQVKKCQNCGHDEHQLLTKSSPFFSDWKFQCLKCLSLKDVVQADKDSLELLKPGMDGGLGNLPKEWNMLPVSYRASSLHYVQTDSFIVFKDTDVASLLTAAKRQELLTRLLKLYNFPGVALTNGEVVRQLRQNGRDTEANDLELLAGIAATLTGASRDALERQLADKRAQYEASGLIAKSHESSPALVGQAEASQDWARRYNPIRLALEHASLRAEVIDRAGSDPSLPAIAVSNPDLCDIDTGDVATRTRYTTSTTEKLTRLGLAEMVFVRQLDICEFSFGFTRVASTPSTTVKDREMPVCLRAFPYVERQKRPIYVLEQKNEGFYIRLDHARVVEWLSRNGFDDALPPRSGMHLGGMLIEQYADFGRFVEGYRERTGESRTARSISSYVYLLLHRLAHHVAHTVVEYSGLDHGSIGEYIFPADLSFLVYRRGMTPDLGNLSAMWRNHSSAVLDRLLSDRALKCDGGSLCDQRGGACPACIMAPEVVCLAGNNLLSRSALNGGDPPSWDADRRALTGYFRL